MAEVIGVRFKNVGKIYYFDPRGLQLQKGDSVIVETARGIECGQVAMANREVSDKQIVSPSKRCCARPPSGIWTRWKTTAGGRSRPSPSA